MTIAELRQLAGINKGPKFDPEGINISRSGTELRQLEKN